MAEIPIAPVELELEVTETLLLDDEELFAARMRQFKTIGVRLAIDDFGTRYTGFNLLKRLPLDTMKIDRCFIRGIHQSADMRMLCSTIIAMARHMKLRTVAEGIEEPEELEVMQQIGCDAGQGYLFQRPVSADEFTDVPARMARAQAAATASQTPAAVAPDRSALRHRLTGRREASHRIRYNPQRASRNIRLCCLEPENDLRHPGDPGVSSAPLPFPADRQDRRV